MVFSRRDTVSNDALLQGEKWAALQQLFTGFMEEVISGMAGYIPLKAIGQRILAQYTQQQFGDFRGTLLGLLSAYNYESSILTTARCASCYAPRVCFHCLVGTAVLHPALAKFCKQRQFEAPVGA